MLVWCWCNVDVMLMWCWCDVGVMLMWCWCDVGVMLVWCWCDVDVMLVWCWCDVGVMLMWCSLRLLPSSTSPWAVWRTSTKRGRYFVSPLVEISSPCRGRGGSWLPCDQTCVAAGGDPCRPTLVHPLAPQYITLWCHLDTPVQFYNT